MSLATSSAFPSDLDIAQAAQMQRITRIAAEKLDVSDEHLEPYGHFKAKLSLAFLDSLRERADGRLVLVTAISPTPAGEGKTTTVIGLGDALNRVGKRAAMCLREPSLGPVFGMKGGATGGGYAQVLPMEDINLHFTGDFSAVALANNLLSALIDNHVHHGNALGIDVRSITWKRVMNMNDRALRDIVVGLGGTANGFPRQDGFDIVVASEVMAILCLADSLEDLKQRLGDIVVGHTHDKRPVTARDLQAHGAMTVLLQKAFAPNLVQTLEHNPVFIHGGPFANIAHGCNSVVATRAALKLADYVVTEAGFGADLGAEKFVNIKCRKSGVRPAACVVVATLRALKFHGGADKGTWGQEDLPALERGMVNLQRHVDNVSRVYGIPCVVALNHFYTDTAAELDLLKRCMAAQGVQVVLSTHWRDGGKGAEALAHEVLRLCEQPAPLQFTYEDSTSLWDKLQQLATTVYRAAGVSASAKVRQRIEQLQEQGHGHLPICVAKTPYSFSTDAQARGAPTGHTLDVREVRLAAGAGFVIMVCGDVMTMPGLPKTPAAHAIDWVDGRVVGLF